MKYDRFLLWLSYTLSRKISSLGLIEMVSADLAKVIAGGSGGNFSIIPAQSEQGLCLPESHRH